VPLSEIPAISGPNDWPHKLSVAVKVSAESCLDDVRYTSSVHATRSLSGPFRVSLLPNRAPLLLELTAGTYKLDRCLDHLGVTRHDSIICI
jgi:hypothetical protein